jgi:hypothetical protein
VEPADLLHGWPGLLVAVVRRSEHTARDKVAEQVTQRVHVGGPSSEQVPDAALVGADFEHDPRRGSIRGQSS